MFPGFSCNPDNALAILHDLTGWECAHSSFHLEDDVPQVNVTRDAEGAPLVSEDDQRVLLVHGAAFALEFSRHMYALRPPAPVRCIVAVNQRHVSIPPDTPRRTLEPCRPGRLPYRQGDRTGRRTR